MAKTSKDTTISAAKNEAKAKAANDPVTTKNLIRLLNILALLLAITAFLLQFFAVITHHWKYQVTHLGPLFNATQRIAPAYIYDDSRIDQSYGLYSRDVKVYANNDEQFDVWASTRFPRLHDENEEELHRCLSQTSTLRGSFLTCARGISSPGHCHCRRYAHWNAVIFFEVTALVLLGLVVIIVSLLTTHYHGLLKPIGILLSFLAFLFLLIGLIILLSYLKRETRSIADAYPYVHSRLGIQVGQRHTSGRSAIVRRQVHETYRAYPLAPGQHAYNETHFQQLSEKTRSWVYIPYSSNPANYAPRSQQGYYQQPSATPQERLRNAYGPLLEHSRVYDSTRACIGWSTVLSILAMILALLLPAILAFSFLKAKSLAPEVRTVTTTTVKTEYVPAPHDVTVETVPLNRPVPTEHVRQGPYDNYGGRQEPVVVRDVIIRDEHPTTQTYRT